MIHFVGAGPGAADLITLRGARLLAEADVVVYAGSLVNPELLKNCKPSCEVHDSSRMTLDQIVDVLCDADARGLACVRLHTGDPALYGAHGEQMDELDKRGIAYDVVPGVSSLFGASAALGIEYTVPGVTQSVVVTRMEGRTPMPKGEELAGFAAHGCTIVLFLSASLLREAQEELLAGGLSASTPAALVVRATWDDEAVYRCDLGSLARCAAEHGVSRTALAVVGQCLRAHEARSLLYDPGFSHGYRQASHGGTRPAAEHDDCLERDSPRAGHAGMRVACAAFTQRGVALAQSLREGLATRGDVTTLSCPSRITDAGDVWPLTSVGAWAHDAWHTADALLFVGAVGIATRAIAPLAHDKMSDPAVVCVDEGARFAIPLLSGHVGGANDLARRVEDLCGAEAVVTTATDAHDVFAVDEWARKNGLVIMDRAEAKLVSASLLEGGEVGFESDVPVAGDLPRGVVQRHCDRGFVVSRDPSRRPFAHTLRLVPRDVVVGVGCKRGTSARRILALIDACLGEAHVASEAVRALATIDIKADEEGVLEAARTRGWDLRLHSAESLAEVSGTFSASEFVLATVGVDNVCERAACADGASLLLGKRSAHGVTVALAAPDRQLSFADAAGRASQERLVVCVGLGPGGADDLTMRAHKALRRAEVIVGYTTYVDLVRDAYPHAEYVATGMRGEVERCQRALELAAAGRRVAVVCSGDPGVYGMAGLLIELAPDYPGVGVEVVAGVTAANGGAAVLGAPLMHDWCTISLSDLMTPWEDIERRLRAAAAAGFCISLYNPSSRGRADHLRRACKILLEYLPADTVCGLVRNIGRDGEASRALTLAELRDAEVDMLTCVFVGNETTKLVDGRMVTPRGYLQRESR